MTKMRPINFLSWAQVPIIFVALLWPMRTSGSTSKIETLYMNSYKFCGHDKSFPVNKRLTYKIEADMSPESATSSFLECEMTFHAEDRDGRICVIQDYPDGVSIKDSNAVLKGRDGINDGDKLIFEIDFKGSGWDHIEYCTETPYLNLHLHKNELFLPVDVNKLHISLKVVEISSPERQIYLDYKICSRTIPLQTSEVSVYSRKNPEEYPSATIGFQNRCGVTFKKEPPSTNTSLCMVYLPQGEPDCSSKWTLYITDGTYSFEEPHVLYKMNCEADPTARQKHAWCAPNTANEILIVHERQTPVFSNSTLEWPMQYHLLVSDFPGGDVKELLRKTERGIAERSGMKGESFSMWWLMLGVGAAVGLFIVFGLIWRCRHRSSSGKSAANRRSSSIAQRDDEDEDDEISRMENSPMGERAMEKGSM